MKFSKFTKNAILYLAAILSSGLYYIIELYSTNLVNIFSFTFLDLTPIVLNLESISQQIVITNKNPPIPSKMLSVPEHFFYFVELYFDLFMNTPTPTGWGTLLQQEPLLLNEILNIFLILYDNFASSNDIKMLLIELERLNGNFDFLLINGFIYNKVPGNEEYFLKGNFYWAWLFFDSWCEMTVPEFPPFYECGVTGILEVQKAFDFLNAQCSFIFLASLFIKKKLLSFYFVNFLLVFFMLWNLIGLSMAVNLIYALLHFLLFALASGLLVIYWGAVYIGFCILLIYGAAIPVLALYIIMLVNVDLIQGLFFVEHTASVSFYLKLKPIILFCLVFFCICFFLQTILIEKPAENYGFAGMVEELSFDMFYLLLAKRFLSTSLFAYAIETPFDLPLAFYISDIDKVATAAYKTSYNELIALVFLLLIAIVVVISISGPANGISTNILYDASEINFFNKTQILYTNKLTKNIMFTCSKIYFLEKFLKLRNSQVIYGGRFNFVHDPNYLYTRRLDGLYIVEDLKDYKTRQLLSPFHPDEPNDPWLFWFTRFGFDNITKDMENLPGFSSYYIYGNNNSTKSDIEVDNYLATFIY